VNGFETIAAVDAEWILVPVVSMLVGVVGFFITRFFSKSDKVEDSNVEHITHIALIHEKLGQHSSSEQKQWSTLDTLTREVADLKLKVAVLEDRKRSP